MEIFLWISSFVFCNMLFRSKFPLLAFCIHVRSKWKIEILKVTQCKVWWIKWKSCDKNINNRSPSRSGTGKRKKKFEVIDRTLCDISPSVFFFSFRQDVDRFPLTDDDSSCFDLSHILLLRCDARWRQAVYPPFPGNKTDGEKGCRLKIGTIPSWRKTFYFGSCKWVVPCRNGLGTVPKIWRAVPFF